MERTYPAKLLLFGEYTVLNGSQALAIPNPMWCGEWKKFGNPPSSDDVNFIQWLFEKSIIDQNTKSRILEDMKEGWHFDSSIPIGHGVGSSGAYVAAIFDRYIKTNNADAAQRMAEMEGYFHGTSSGMDPLVSFENMTVLKDTEGKFHLCGKTKWPDGFKLYLWDSNIERTTHNLVATYREKYQDEKFKQKTERDLIPMVDHAIHFYISHHGDMLMECIRFISQFQRTYFSDMIPDKVKFVWDACEEVEDVHMKLCGAGGGGFFMIITRNGATPPVPNAMLIHSS